MHVLACPLCRIALPPNDPVCPRDGHAGREVGWHGVPHALGLRFHTLEPFAHGDAGSLYIADEPETGRRGLLKILAPAAREQLAERQRLRRELVKQATLARNHLVVPLASGDADGATWIFREWLEGVTLEVRLSRGGPLKQIEALAIAAQVASALDELHRGGLLHRDIKPGHVFLQPTSHGLPRVLLLDAGIAGPIALRGGAVFGTPGYVAPEQLLGNLVSFRSDLYSLGCVLYRMLTGRPAFEGADHARTLEAQRAGELPPVPPTLPPGIRQLLSSLLSREPQERPFSAQKLRRTLEPFLPDDALIERQPTSSFEMIPRDSKPAVLASGTLRPPAPPTARPVGSGTVAGPAVITPARAEPPPDERTDQLDLDQVEEELQARSHPPPPPGMQPPSDKTQPIRLDQILAVADGRRAAAKPPPAMRDREDATLVEPPRELEYAAPAASTDFRARDASTEFRPRDQQPGAALVSADSGDEAGAPPGATDFRRRDDAPPLSADFRPRDDEAALPPDPRFDDPSGRGTLRGPVPPRDDPDSGEQTTIQVDELGRVFTRPAPSVPDAHVEPEPPRGIATGKQTLLGIGISTPRGAGPWDEGVDPRMAPGAQGGEPLARTTAPGEPAPRFASPKSTLPLNTALPSAASLQDLPASVNAPSDAASPVDASASHGARAARGSSRKRERDIATESIPVQGVADDSGLTATPWWLFGGDKRRALMYGSAALVGLAVLGVGVSALFSGAPEPAPELAERGAPAAPPPLPTVAAVARRDEPPPEPVRTPQPAQAAPAPRDKPAAREPEPTPRAARSESAAKRESAKPPPAKVPAPSKAPVAKAPAAKDVPSKPAAPDTAVLFAEAREQARTAYSAKRYKDAADAYERAARYDPSHAPTYAGLGAARLQLGDEKGAVQAYQRAVQLSPSTSGFHAALGRAYLSAGDEGRARSAYKQALALDPKNEAAKTALKSL